MGQGGLSMTAGLRQLHYSTVAMKAADKAMKSRAARVCSLSRASIQADPGWQEKAWWHSEGRMVGG